MTITLRGGHTTTDVRLGRVPQPDENNRRYSISAVLPADAEVRRKTWTLRATRRLDQLKTPRCVGYATAQRMNASPHQRNLRAPDADALYRLAQDNDQWAGSCVDMSTQALTRRGWLSGDQIRIGDEILALDTETEMLRWSLVKNVHRYQRAAYREWHQRGTTIAVTDNHRWVVTNRNLPGRYELVETTGLKSQHAVPRSAPMVGPDLSTTDDELVELVAWTMTEGYYRPPSRRGNGVVISQKIHADRVANLVGRTGSRHGTDGQRSWEISGEIATAIRMIAPDRAPSIEWLASLTQRQLRLFIEVCILADGYTSQPRGNRKGVTGFSQLPGARLDAFLAACTLAGQPVSRGSIDPHTGVETWTLRGSNRIECRRLEPSPFIVGDVWCPESTLGTFVARREGTVWITGNSYDGTSVLGGMKAAQIEGLVSVYRWATTLDEILLAISHEGPVVCGTTWFEDMFTPDNGGYIRPTGKVAGGHCYVLRGVDPTRERVRMTNSWGDWGMGGDAWIAYADLEQLAQDPDAEFAIPTES